MALADIKGQPAQQPHGAKNDATVEWHDYSHLVPDHLRPHIRLYVAARPKPSDTGADVRAIAMAGPHTVGQVSIFMNRKTGNVEPHSSLDMTCRTEHRGCGTDQSSYRAGGAAAACRGERVHLRGAGLGRAMYEAGLAHAMKLGGKYAQGEASADAAQVHSRLGQKHGMNVGSGEDTADGWVYRYRLR